MRKYQLLESIDLILKRHQVRDRFVSSMVSNFTMCSNRSAYPSLGSLIDFKLMYSSYSNVPIPRQIIQIIWAFCFHTIEFGVLLVECELSEEEVDVFCDERTIT